MKDDDFWGDIGKVLLKMPPKQLKNFINMTNNNIGKEEKHHNSLSKRDSIRFFDFKFISKIPFSDERASKIKELANPVMEYFSIIDPSEINARAENFDGFIEYRYSKKYKVIPSKLYLTDDVIDGEFLEKFIKELDLPEYCYSSYYRFNNKEISLKTIFINLGWIVLYYDGNGIDVFFPNDILKSENNFLDLVFGVLKNYKKPTNNVNKIYTVYRGPYGFDKKDFTLKKTKNIDIRSNYNDGFEEVAKEIIHALNDKNRTGLVILPGIPGTGKTTFLRYLATKIKKDIIFVSPDMIHHITEPDFIPFLMENENSVLILEDAEDALQKRSGSRTGAVSNILNLTDGLLSDCLNISIVATFNTDMKNIDEALLRKGRLFNAYKFEKLSVDKAKELMIKRGKDPDLVKEPMTLAEIYHIDVNIIDRNNIFSEKKKIGF